jgi:hypothetical protein
LAASIKRAMDHYQTANTVWQVKFDKMHLGRLESVSNFIFLEDKRDTSLIDLQSLFKKYPEIKDNVKKDPSIGTNLHIATAVQIIWKEAEKELRKAVALLSENYWDRITEWKAIKDRARWETLKKSLNFEFTLT